MATADDSLTGRVNEELALVGVARGRGYEVTEVDDNYLRIVGLTRDQFEHEGLNWFDITPPEHVHRDAAATKQIDERGGFAAPYQKDYIRRDGSRVPVLIVGAQLPATDEWLTYVVDLSRKAERATDRLAADRPFDLPQAPEFLLRLVAELVRERDRITTMLDSTSTLVWAVDSSMRLLGANRPFLAEMERRFGSAPEIGDCLVRPDESPELSQLWESLYQRAIAGEQYSHRLSLRDDDGTVEHYENVFSPVVEDGEVVGATVVSHRITAQLQAQKALRASESRFRTLTEASPLGIFEVGVDGVFTFANERMAEIWEIEAGSLLRDGCLTSLHDADAEHVRREWESAIARGGAVELEYRVLLPDGAPRYVRTWLRPVRDGDRLTGFVGSVEDETSRRVLALRMHQNERLESLGTLAGGIAHDFNNMLSVILGNIELAQLIDDDASRNDHLDQIRDASLRARDLVRQILTFSRQSTQERVPLDLVDAATGCLRLLRASIPSSVELETDFTFDPVVVDADESGLQQVLVNLCVNSSHALRGRAGARIVLRVRREDDHAVLTVSDNGQGMSIETQRRALEPFYSTKVAGEGTGMGLAVVHGIVTVHGGTVALESAPGQGTDVHVRLPLSESEVAVEAPRAPSRGPDSPIRILLVEDEFAIAAVVDEVLSRSGHEVTWVSDGAAALARYRAAPQDFDLLISDVTLPGLTGDQIAERVREIRAGMPIILMTGYSSIVDAEIARSVGAVYLQKPFGVAELEQAVAEAVTLAASREDSAGI